MLESVKNSSFLKNLLMYVRIGDTGVNKCAEKS